MIEPLQATLRSLSWSLRWEQARMLQQLETILELSDAIQSGRQASSVFRGQENPLHLDFTLATMNAIRAYCALMVAGLIWIETGWDGARGGMIVTGILCSLMATFPRPLLAAQSFARGLGLALVAVGGAAVRAGADDQQLRAAWPCCWRPCCMPSRWGCPARPPRAPGLDWGS